MLACSLEEEEAFTQINGINSDPRRPAVKTFEIAGVWPPLQKSTSKYTE